jgi:NAD(P)-dependent dehydrogenase (short-subunit alcohol dehydrogenase family)
VGKRAIFISGANGGMGAALVPRLLERGWKVYAGVMSDRGSLPDSPDIVILRCDITDSAVVRETAAKITELQGKQGLQAVLNLTGIPIQGPVETVDEADFRRAFEINFWGAFHIIQAFLPLLRAGRGRIINVPGVLARVAVPFAGPIASSKGALLLLSDTIRMELAPWDIPVIAIEPSGIRTPALKSSAESLAGSLSNVPSQQKALYQEMVKLAQDTKIGSDSVNVAAKVIIKALESTNPRPYYLVGRSAPMITMLTYLPARLRDMLIRRSMGLNKL